MGYGTTLFRHKVTVEPYIGDSAVGETFGPAVPNVRCRFRLKQRVIRSSRGDEVVADAILECRASETFAEGDRVTRGGKTFRVHEIRPVEMPHSATNHLEVWLRAD